MDKFITVPMVIEGEMHEYLLQIFGNNTQRDPYVIKIWKVQEQKYVRMLQEGCDFNLNQNSVSSNQERADLIHAVYMKVLEWYTVNNRLANNGAYPYSDYVVDTVRLRGTCTRPDLKSWLHPTKADEIPYAVDIYSDRICRYITKRFTLSKQIYYFPNSFQSIAGFSYANWWFPDSKKTHDVSREYANRWLKIWDKSPGFGLRYEYADLLDIANDLTLTDSSKYKPAYPVEESL